MLTFWKGKILTDDEILKPHKYNINRSKYNNRKVFHNENVNLRAVQGNKMLSMLPYYQILFHLYDLILLFCYMNSDLRGKIVLFLLSYLQKFKHFMLIVSISHQGCLGLCDSSMSTIFIELRPFVRHKSFTEIMRNVYMVQSVSVRCNMNRWHWHCYRKLGCVYFNANGLVNKKSMDNQQFSRVQIDKEKV